MVLLPNLLAGSSANKYLAAPNVFRSGNTGGIINWPEAVQNLLRTYVTEKLIIEALVELRNIHQYESENEMAYDAWLNNTAYRFGNENDGQGNVYLYVKRLIPIVATIVQSFRNAKYHMELST